MKVRAKPEVHDHVFDEYDNQCLEPKKVYEVIGLSSKYFRVIDESGEPIFYPKYLFDIIDSTIPDWWIKEDFKEDDYYFINPPELSRREFYEDYFDHKPEAIEIFEKFLVSYGLKTK